MSREMDLDGSHVYAGAGVVYLPVERSVILHLKSFPQ